MPEASTIVYVCPGCGEVIEPAEDYVVARAYESQSDFVLHLHGDESARARRRFHVAHFRRQIGECVYELVQEEGSDGRANTTAVG
jgi:hypothetical protein